MCTVSMVYDHYYPRIPYAPVAPNQGFIYTPPALDVEELRTLIAEFKEAVAAAKVVDRLTDQPDCADPEKAALEERVRHLEEVVAGLRGRSS